MIETVQHKPRGRRASARDARVAEIFSRFAARNPHPRGELDYINPFTLLVAVVLSAQATDLGVNRATKSLFAVADTPEKMASLGEEVLREKIKTIGLFRAKAKNVIELSRQLIARFDSQVPQTLEELQSLPGVGRKTANVVLNIAFGQKTIAVDTHLFRVSNRIPLAKGKTPEAVEKGLLAIDTRRISPARSPLADSARALHLQGAQARLPRLSDLRSLPLAGKDRADYGASRLSLTRR